MMMKRLGLAVICVLWVCGGGVGRPSVSQAGGISPISQSLTDLLGANPQPLGSLLLTDVTNGNLWAEVHSRAYTDGAGPYAYLYQMHNTGRAGKSVDVGEHSVALYVMSDLPPDRITGYVINSGVGSGPVVGPVPEPASAALGLPALIRWRRKK